MPANDCLRCHKPTAPEADPDADIVKYCKRGLCKNCYSYESNHGNLDNYPNYKPGAARKPAFVAEDTEWRTPNASLVLRETRYRQNGGGAAQLADDGIIDPVAIERFVNGDNTVRLSQREVVCVVAELAGRGVTDWQIAARFGRDSRSGCGWIRAMRRENRIESKATETVSDNHVARLILEPAVRAKAAPGVLVACGILAAE